jgi:hypothetical protein
MPEVVSRIGVVVHEVIPGNDLTHEVFMVGVNARIDDCHGY